MVGRDLLISISGASIKQPGDLWTSVLDWMDVPNSTSETKTAELKGELEAEAKGSMGIPFLSKGEVGAKGTFGGTLGKTAEQVRERRGLPQVVNEIANSDFTILLDDFHYMPREV